MEMIQINGRHKYLQIHSKHIIILWIPLQSVLPTCILKVETMYNIAQTVPCINYRNSSRDNRFFPIDIKFVDDHTLN